MGSNNPLKLGLINLPSLLRDTTTLKHNQIIHCFFKHSLKGKVFILTVYIDDIILTRDDLTKIDKLKKILVEEFEIKDLGSLKYFVGVEVARSKNGYQFLKENTF